MGFVRSYGTPLEAAAQLGAEDVPGLATVDDSLWIDTCAPSRISTACTQTDDHSHLNAWRFAPSYLFFNIYIFCKW